MRMLLDTHTLLWLIEGSPHLSVNAQAVLIEPANELYVSVASIWELAIKTTKPNQLRHFKTPYSCRFGNLESTTMWQLAIIFLSVRESAQCGP